MCLLAGYSLGKVVKVEAIGLERKVRTVKIEGSRGEEAHNRCFEVLINTWLLCFMLFWNPLMFTSQSDLVFGILAQPSHASERGCRKA